MADHRLEAEVAALPESCWLGAQGEFRVGLARAAQIPALLDEIGRLREITFRAAGEGTGRARDLDAFDAYYRHLFVWHRGDRALAGAYRLGLTDEIRRERGADGLYTQTLFRYDERLLDRLSPAIELGRSFVRAEYQRDYAPLLLLWKGIGRFVRGAPALPYRRAVRAGDDQPGLQLGLEAPADGLPRGQPAAAGPGAAGGAAQSAARGAPARRGRGAPAGRRPISTRPTPSSPTSKPTGAACRCCSGST